MQSKLVTIKAFIGLRRVWSPADDEKELNSEIQISQTSNTIFFQFILQLQLADNIKHFAILAS